MATPRTDPSTDVIPLMAHAHGTPSEYRAWSRRSPIGMAMPIVSPSGASVATVTATRPANGRSIRDRSSGWRPKATAAIRAAAVARAAASVRRGSAASREVSRAPRPVVVWPRRSERSSTGDWVFSL